MREVVIAIAAFVAGVAAVLVFEELVIYGPNDDAPFGPIEIDPTDSAGA